MAGGERLLVLGGGGFVGRAICKEAVRRGLVVTSLTRSGAPPLSPTEAGGLLGRVAWARGSALDVDTLRPLVGDATYIVHSIGTLFERNALYSACKGGSAPPSAGESYMALSYDTLERTLACLGSKEAAASPLRAFAYVGADAMGKALLPRYFEAKAAAEDLLVAAAREQSFRAVIARPSFMYGRERPQTLALALPIGALSLFTGRTVTQPLSVDAVARAILAALCKEPPGTDDGPSPAVILTASQMAAC